MSNITVNCKELRALLDRTPSSHNIMLVGKHGIGKSEILTNYYSSKGMKVVALFLGQMSDPGDIIGLPNKNEKNGKTEFMPPYWFPIGEEPICLFLDELNRARPEILQTVMDLCLNRTLAGRPLPKGSMLIAAVNQGEQYQLTDLDPALVSRFNIVNFKPTVEEWLLWADNNKIDSRVISFINENKVWLDKEPDSIDDADTGLEKTPDRRAWKRVSDIIQGRDALDEMDNKIISSIVGPRAASAFVHNLASRKLLSAEEVLSDFARHKDALNNYELHEVSVVTENLYRMLEVQKVSPQKVRLYADNLENYFFHLTKHNKESAAHFASIFANNTYPKAIAFMSINSPILVNAMVSYIKGLK